MTRILIACALLLATMVARGTSYIFPTYSTPILADGLLIATSPDNMRLIGLTLEGKQKWVRRLSVRGSVYKHSSGKVMLITGSSVGLVNSGNGDSTPLFEAKAGLANLRYLESADLFFGTKESVGVSTLVVYDGPTHRMLLNQKNGETVAYADKGLIVLAKGKRKHSKDGYSFSSGWLEGFNRETGKRIWQMEFEKQSWPFHDVCRVGDHVVCEDGPDLLVMPAGGGKIRRQAAAKPADSIGPSGLRSEKGMLMYVASELNTSDFNRSKQTVYRVSVPELKIVETKVVEVIEAARVETAGEYLISDALYRTACFRRDGSKVWEHFQMHRTGVIDGMIYFSDYEKGVARLGALKVSSGKQKILISERVELK